MIADRVSPWGLSVIICSHNGSQRLPRTLAHLAGQRGTDGLSWEVILVDNASRDETSRVARQCWPADSRVPLRIASEIGRKEFVLVSLVAGEQGAVAFPSAKGSGAVTSFSQADGFIEIDALAAGLDADATAQVTLIGAAASAPDVVIMGSHDIALDVVVGALAERGFRARTIAIGSLGGAAAARKSFKSVARRRRQSLEGRGFSDSTEIIRRFRDEAPA